MLFAVKYNCPVVPTHIKGYLHAAQLSTHFVGGRHRMRRVVELDADKVVVRLLVERIGVLPRDVALLRGCV